MLSARSSLLAVLSAGCLTTWASAAEPIAPQQFHEVLKIVKPQPGEDKWADIPWLADLWQARQAAAKAGKPILLWEMDGNPLGCV
jgi:hypothetical protein